MELISFGLTATAGIVGWFVKLLWGGQKELREELKSLELKLVGDYRTTRHQNSRSAKIVLCGNNE